MAFITEKPKLCSVTFSQEQDCCGPTESDEQKITIETCDGGGGTYFVIKTDRWAFDNIEELQELLKTITSCTTASS